MGYGFNSAPFWRIYCEQHSDIPIKKKLLECPNTYYESIIKFTRQLNKQLDITSLSLHPHTNNNKNTVRKIAFKSNGTEARRIKDKEKIVDAYLQSFIQNNIASNRFYIVLDKLTGGDYRVSSVNIPSKYSDDFSLGKRPTRPL